MAEWPYLPEVGALANRIGAMPDASIPGASGMVWDLRPRKALQGQTDALFVMERKMRCSGAYAVLSRARRESDGARHAPRGRIRQAR